MNAQYVYFLFINSEECPFLCGYFASGTSYCLFLKFQDRPLGFQEVEPLTYPAHWYGKVVSPTHLPPLHPWKYSCYTFLLATRRKDYVNEEFPWHHRVSNPRTSLSQPTVPPCAARILMCECNTFVPWRWKQLLMPNVATCLPNRTTQSSVIWNIQRCIKVTS